MSIEQLAIKLMWSFIVVISAITIESWLLARRIIRLSKKVDQLLASMAFPKGDS